MVRFDIIWQIADVCKAPKAIGGQCMFQISFFFFLFHEEDILQNSLTSNITDSKYEDEFANFSHVVTLH